VLQARTQQIRTWRDASCVQQARSPARAASQAQVHAPNAQ
jgi:hypothetical protein